MSAEWHPPRACAPKPSFNQIAAKSPNELELHNAAPKIERLQCGECRLKNELETVWSPSRRGKDHRTPKEIYGTAIIPTPQSLGGPFGQSMK